MSILFMLKISDFKCTNFNVLLYIFLIPILYLIKINPSGKGILLVINHN